MAIRAGQILHVANQFVVDRIQTGGAGSLNIPQEKVFELGNYQSVGIVRDVPDLSFSLDCLDVDTEIEALLVGSLNPDADARSNAGTPGNATNGAKYELAFNKSLDIISPWKTPYGAFTAVRGVAIPALGLESASYRYGLRENAGETFSLRGDSIFYVPGTPHQDIIILEAGDTPSVGGTYAFENGPALLYTEQGSSVYALSVSMNGERLINGRDYVDTNVGISLTATREAELADLVGDLTGTETIVLSIVYGSLVTQVYGVPNQDASNPAGGVATPGVGRAEPDATTVHAPTSVKPAAIRGKDIKVWFATKVGGTYVDVQWPDVQSVTIDWRQTLEEDYEFGNPRAVSREATDVPEVSGTIELKPRSVEALFTRLTQITGVPAADIIGPQSSVIGQLRVELRNPDSGGSAAQAAGAVLKTHHIGDARFTIPGYEGRVQQKLTSTLNWESDTGTLATYKGFGPRVPQADGSMNYPE